MAIVNSAAANPLISVVDNDASLRNSAQRLIRAFGFRAEVFESARQFLQTGNLEETAGLILDVRMPEMDGLELQRHLAETDHPLPIIFVTGSASDDEQQRALQAGAVDFLRKPVSEQALINAIHAALRQGGCRANGGLNPP